MNSIKRYQHAQDSSVSVENSYSENQLMHILLDKFHQGGKCTANIAIHQAELIREEKLFTKNIHLLHLYRLTIQILTAV